jgi:two-component system, chemotaxis family, chemotaxis protein CheY
VKGNVPSSWWFSTGWWCISANYREQLTTSNEQGVEMMRLHAASHAGIVLALIWRIDKNLSLPVTKEVVMSEFKSGFFVGGESCNGRVLVVDDEPDIRKVVRMTLQKAGYDVLEAENGEKAIEVINSGENRLLLDVMICDIRMPKVNGIEAIAYFRQNYPRVPLIVLTGFPDTDMATSLLRQGVVDYLVKPVEGEKLKASVARAMEQRELAHL